MEITPTADFLPPGAELNANETSVAGYLQRAWDDIATVPGAGQTYGDMSRVFGMVYNDQTAASYAETLDAISGQASAFSANDQTLAARGGLDNAFSCPRFAGDSGTLLGETSCVWANVTGAKITYDAVAGAPARKISTGGFRAGGQGEFAPDWFFGATAAYASVSSDANSVSASSNGDRFNAEFAVKHVAGPWYFRHRRGRGLWLV